MPDYAAIIISANNGIQRMTKEHLGLCLALKIPFYVVITRVDTTPEPVIKNTTDNVLKLLKHPGPGSWSGRCGERDVHGWTKGFCLGYTPQEHPDLSPGRTPDPLPQSGPRREKDVQLETLAVPYMIMDQPVVFRSL